jgi:hypothetical protein
MKRREHIINIGSAGGQRGGLNPSNKRSTFCTDQTLNRTICVLATVQVLTIFFMFFTPPRMVENGMEPILAKHGLDKGPGQGSEPSQLPSRREGKQPVDSHQQLSTQRDDHKFTKHQKEISAKNVPPPSLPKPKDGIWEFPSIDELDFITPEEAETLSFEQELPKGEDPRFVIPASPHWRLRPTIKNQCYKGSDVGLCKKDNRVYFAADLEYPVWSIRMPKFPRKEYADFFIKLAQVVDYIRSHDASKCPPEKCPTKIEHDPTQTLVFYDEQYTIGQIVIVENGLYNQRPSMSFGGDTECEWPNSYDMILRDDAGVSSNPAAAKYDKVAVFTGPQAWSFQHFMDRLMPDVAQAYDFIAPDPSWVLVGPDGAFTPLAAQPGENEDDKPEVGGDMKAKIWTSMFPHHTTLSPHTQVIGKLMNYACRVPRFHPWIWQKIQELIGGELDPPTHYKKKIIMGAGGGGGGGGEGVKFEEIPILPINERKKVVYLTRRNTRKVMNEGPLLEAMQQWVKARGKGEEIVVFEHAKYPTKKAIKELFNYEAKAVIGPHGGAFYNINFCARGTVVVEFFPCSAGASPRGHRYPEGTWWQSACLDHRFWSLPLEATGGGDVVVPIDDVIHILNTEFGDK